MIQLLRTWRSFAAGRPRCCRRCRTINRPVAHYCRSCGARLDDRRSPRVTVITRLGSRSPLYPPCLILRNDSDFEVRITDVVLRNCYELVHPPGLRGHWAIALAPGQRTHLPVERFRRSDHNGPLEPDHLPLRIPYYMVANGVPICGETLIWLGNPVWNTTAVA